MSVSVAKNVEVVPPVLWRFLHMAQESILGRHLAYFLVGWLLLIRWDCRPVRIKQHSGWSEFLNLAGPRYWPLVLAGFLWFLVVLVLITAKIVGYAQPILVFAGAVSACAWWVGFFCAVSVVRYLRGRDCLLCFEHRLKVCVGPTGSSLKEENFA